MLYKQLFCVIVGGNMKETISVNIGDMVEVSIYPFDMAISVNNLNNKFPNGVLEKINYLNNGIIEYYINNSIINWSYCRKFKGIGT